jgi:RNA polymerase sigma factor (TIGR02999 family)
MTRPADDITGLLQDVSAGKRDAWDRLLAVVYRELHTLAHDARYLRRPGGTMQTTALVNEAYMRLVRDRGERWRNRSHFFSVASRAMRQIMVGEYRRVQAVKRGRGRRPVSLAEVGESDPVLSCSDSPFTDWEALDRALDKLGAEECYRRKCTAVELRFFVGLTFKETAEVLGVSLATVKRDWEFTRAWLFQEMRTAGVDDGERRQD